MNIRQLTPDKLDVFFRLRRHLTIAHHIPGRIRFRVKASVFNEVEKFDSKLLDDVLGVIPAIDDVRVNKIAGTVVIAYSTNAIQASWWETLITADRNTATALLEELAKTCLATAATKLSNN